MVGYWTTVLLLINKHISRMRTRPCLRGQAKTVLLSGDDALRGPGNDRRRKANTDARWRGAALAASLGEVIACGAPGGSGLEMCQRSCTLRIPRWRNLYVSGLKLSSEDRETSESVPRNAKWSILRCRTGSL